MNIISSKQSSSLWNHTELYVKGCSNKRSYRIYIAVPDNPPPQAGYPVIYLLDANSVFGTMTEAVRLQSRRPEVTGVQPSIIVGVGYPSAEPFPAERHYDFTRSTPDDELPPHPAGGQWPEQGGADDFLNFIEEELQPYIRKNYIIDGMQQTIFGHSLGGLFVLHTLFNKPHLFSCYIAGSPSIHWNKHSLSASEQQFAKRIHQAPLPIRLLIAVGELEQSHKSGMNSNARQLAARLEVQSEHGLHVKYKEFSGEGHISILPALISRAIRFQSESTDFR